MTADKPSVAEVRKAEIRARLEAITPPPWRWEVSADRKWSWVGTDAPRHDFWEQPVAKCSDDDDAEFIAHAPTDVAFLLEENARLEGLLAEAEVQAASQYQDSGVEG